MLKQRSKTKTNIINLMKKKQRGFSAHNGLTLKDLIDVEKWQTIQDDLPPLRKALEKLKISS